MATLFEFHYIIKTLKYEIMNKLSFFRYIVKLVFDDVMEMGKIKKNLFLTASAIYLKNTICLLLIELELSAE